MADDVQGHEMEPLLRAANKASKLSSELGGQFSSTMDSNDGIILGNCLNDNNVSQEDYNKTISIISKNVNGWKDIPDGDYTAKKELLQRKIKQVTDADNKESFDIIIKILQCQEHYKKEGGGKGAGTTMSPEVEKLINKHNIKKDAWIKALVSIKSDANFKRCLEGQYTKKNEVSCLVGMISNQQFQTQGEKNYCPFPFLRS